MTEYTAIFGTLAGVLIGGLLNFIVSRTVKMQEWRLGIAKEQLARRQDLYADYLAEIQRLTAQRIYGPLEVPKDVHALDRLVAQMTLLSPEDVVQAAREFRRHLFRDSSPASETPAQDLPTFNQLNRTFLEAAKRDIRSYTGDA